MKFVAFSSIPAVVRQRAGLMRPFLSHSSSHEVLHPSEQTYSPAAIHLDDEDLKRIGSWLLDDVPRFEQLSALGADPFLVGGPPSQHQQEYMATLGVTGSNRSNAFFSSLRVVQDGSMQSYKSRQLAEMRDRIRGAGTVPPRSAGVMLLRGGSGRRRILVNETELAGALSARGFKVIDPMTTAVSDIASACAAAEIVIGVEGSHMVHAVLTLAPGTSFITIQPPFKFDNTCKPYCDALGIKYAFTVGHPAEGGFSVEFDRILRIIDKTVASQCQKASYAR